MYDSTGHQFIVQLLAGTPAQPVHVVLDSGSPITGFFVDSVSLKRFEHGERPNEKGRDLPGPHRHRAQAACLFKLSNRLESRRLTLTLSSFMWQGFLLSPTVAQNR